MKLNIAWLTIFGMCFTLAKTLKLSICVTWTKVGAIMVFGLTVTLSSTFIVSSLISLTSN